MNPANGDEVDRLSDDSEMPMGGTGVGALLRASRERHGEALADVARTLKIRYPYLEAIEGGNFTALPGATYAIGFVRAYSSHLGLDSEEVVRRFKVESAGGGAKQELSFPTPVAETGIPGGAVVLIGLVVSVMAYGAWYLSTTRDGFFTEMVSPIPERLSALLNGDETDRKQNPANQPVERLVSGSPPPESERATSPMADVQNPVGEVAAAATKMDPPATVVPAPAETTPLTGSSTFALAEPVDNLPVPMAPIDKPAVKSVKVDDHTLQPAANLASAPGAMPKPVIVPVPQSEPVVPPRPDIASPPPPSADGLPLSTRKEASKPAVKVTVPVPVPVPVAPPATTSKAPPTMPAHTAPISPVSGSVPGSPAKVARHSESSDKVSLPGAVPSAPLPAPPPAQPPAQPPTRPIAEPASASPDATGQGNANEPAIEVAAAPAPFRIVIKASGDSWIQIRDKVSEKMLLTRLLQAGEQYNVPDRKGLVLLTGNAGALHIQVDGEPVPSIGGAGVVRRDVALDPARLKAGTAISR